jgi:hypothetical protein
MAARQAMAGTLALRILYPVALMAPLLMLLVWWVVSSSLAPVARVRRQVAERQADDLTEVSRALNDHRAHRQLHAGEAEGLNGLWSCDASDLKEDAPWLDHGNPLVWSALTGTHAGFCRLLGNWLVREDADPDLAAAIDLARHCASGSFDLSGGDPGWLGRGNAEVAEGHGAARLSRAGHATSLHLAPLDSLRHQHGYAPDPAFSESGFGFSTSAGASPR